MLCRRTQRRRITYADPSTQMEVRSAEQEVFNFTWKLCRCHVISPFEAQTRENNADSHSGDVNLLFVSPFTLGERNVSGFRPAWSHVYKCHSQSLSEPYSLYYVRMSCIHIILASCVLACLCMMAWRSALGVCSRHSYSGREDPKSTV